MEHKVNCTVCGYQGYLVIQVSILANPPINQLTNSILFSQWISRIHYKSKIENLVHKQKLDYRT